MVWSSRSAIRGDHHPGTRSGRSEADRPFPDSGFRSRNGHPCLLDCRLRRTMPTTLVVRVVIPTWQENAREIVSGIPGVRKVVGSRGIIRPIARFSAQAPIVVILI